VVGRIEWCRLSGTYWENYECEIVAVMTDPMEDEVLVHSSLMSP
jgi:hypothetical protein